MNNFAFFGLCQISDSIFLHGKPQFYLSRIAWHVGLGLLRLWDPSCSSLEAFPNAFERFLVKTEAMVKAKSWLIKEAVYRVLSLIAQPARFGEKNRSTGNTVWKEVRAVILTRPTSPSSPVFIVIIYSLSHLSKVQYYNKEIRLCSSAFYLQ